MREIDQEKNPPAEVPEIPDLKKKEQDRKKAGGAWVKMGGGRGAAFNGARGGNGVASTFAGARALGGAEAVLSMPQGGYFAGLLSALRYSLFGQFIGRLWATLAGRALLAGMATALLGGVIFLAGRLIEPQAVPAQQAPDLGGINSSLRVSRASGDRMGYAARAAKGEIRFEPTKTPEPPKVEDETELIEQPPVEDHQAQLNRLPPLAGAKLTDQMGQKFGNSNIFNNPNAPQFGQIIDRSRIAQLTQIQRSQARAMRPGASARAASQRGRARGRSSRAMGQLKLARGMSVAGANATSADPQKGFATDAFDQRVTNPAEIPDPSLGGGTPVTGGGGASGGGINPGYIPPAPPIPSEVPVMPIQPMIDAINALAGLAAMLKMIGMMLMIIGLIFIAIGIALIVSGFGALIGAMFIAIGLMFMAMGMMMMQQAGQLGGVAKGISAELEQLYGQQRQSEISDECIDQAVNNGTDPSQCQPSQTAPNMEFGISEAVEEERNSEPTLEVAP
ncbi:MAG: hypothetical protein HY549_10750 [Elusimicrobia bacterium]|nr:hypothetical protein [Elusimicrobiota bacterium]